jgi:hypothetical protein
MFLLLWLFQINNVKAESDVNNLIKYSDYYFKFFLEKKLYDSDKTSENLDLSAKKRNMLVDLGDTYISVIGGYALLNNISISPMVDNFEYYSGYGSSLLEDKVYYLRDENGYKIKFQTKNSKIINFEILEKGSALYEEKVKNFFSLQKKASECQKSSQFINYANALAGASSLDKSKSKLLEEINRNPFFINNRNYSFNNPIRINKVGYNQKSEGVRIFKIPNDDKIRIMPVLDYEITEDGEYNVSNVPENADRFYANFKNGSLVKIKDCVINSIKK